MRCGKRRHDDVSVDFVLLLLLVPPVYRELPVYVQLLVHSH